VLGGSLSLTGPLAPLGQILKLGYQQAVADINARGGVSVGTAQRPVQLVILDNRSDPNTAAAQARELMLSRHVTVQLGGATPPITVPEAQVAEHERVPLVTSATPIGAFLHANPAGWRYSWAFFWDEQQIASTAFQAAATVITNRRVALFTDTEADGVIERPLFKHAAQAAGYTVAGDYAFPVGTSDFSSFITDAKANRADVLIAQVTTPDGVALFKQMRAMGYAPRIPIVYKAAASSAWVHALGPLADGTVAPMAWMPDAGLPDSAHLMNTLGNKVPGVADVGGAALGYAVVEVVLDAITRAGSTDPQKINAALAATDADYPVGHVRFTDRHIATTAMYYSRWQGGQVVLLSALAARAPA
jgi:branched-chain amino acid transport system substrate-binding protein